jgi:hypothetical protein
LLLLFKVAIVIHLVSMWLLTGHLHECLAGLNKFCEISTLNGRTYINIKGTFIICNDGKATLYLSRSLSLSLGENKLIFQWDDDEDRFVLDQHAELNFYSVSLLKQQSAGRQVAPLGHIILIPSQRVFALSP